MTMAHVIFIATLSAVTWNGTSGFTMPASSAGGRDCCAAEVLPELLSCCAAT